MRQVTPYFIRLLAVGDRIPLPRIDSDGILILLARFCMAVIQWFKRAGPERGRGKNEDVWLVDRWRSGHICRPSGSAALQFRQDRRRPSCSRRLRFCSSSRRIAIVATLISRGSRGSTRSCLAYWLVRHDILTAREHLNFSTLGSKPAAAQKATLYEAVNMIQLGAMPLPSFKKLHPEAR